MLSTTARCASRFIRHAATKQLQRNIGLSAASLQKLDPVQQVFVDQITNYKKLSEKQGGPPDAGAEYEGARQEAIARIGKMYNMQDDPMKFPQFKFDQPDLNQDDTDFTES